MTSDPEGRTVPRRSFLHRILRQGPVRRVVIQSVEKPAQSVAGLVIGTLFVGTIFYHAVEGWNLLDSLYFCVITLTTIGYGDFTPKTDLGKLFTIIYAFAGIGLLATFIQLRAQQRIERNRRLKTTKDANEATIGPPALFEEILPHDPL